MSTMSSAGDIASALADAIACKVPKEATEKFVDMLALVSKTTGDTFLQHVSDIIQAISQESVSVISSKKFCDELISCVSNIPDHQQAITAFQTILSRIQGRNIAFEAQVVELRVKLSKRLELTGNLREAANVLSDIPLENGQRTYTVHYKMKIYLQIAEYLLLLSEVTEAEAYINRASLLLPECQDEDLLVRHKVAYAFLLDHKRKFLEAGQRYAEISIRFPSVPEEDRLVFLERALAAALLSSAGHQRGRLLATLYKDERCQGFKAFPILEKMYLSRLIDRASMLSLESLFRRFYPQLFSQDEDGAQAIQRLLELALVEHNMVAVSLIYDNITLKNLGDLLEVSPESAEAIACEMISEDRLCGQIDQIEGIIRFDAPVNGQDPVLDLWNVKIRGLCTAVNEIADEIEATHPEWARAQLVNRMVTDPTP